MDALYELQNGIVSLQLEDEAQNLVSSGAFEQHGRSARLLVEHGDLHVLMVALAPGAAMPDHNVEGPALVQALRGEAVLRAGDDDAWTLAPRGLLSNPPGLDHSVETVGGCVLLAVVHRTAELRIFGPGSQAPRARTS